MLRLLCHLRPSTLTAIRKAAEPSWFLEVADGPRHLRQLAIGGSYDAIIISLMGNDLPSGRAVTESDQSVSAVASLPAAIVIVVDESITSMRSAIDLARTCFVELVVLRNGAFLEGLSEAVRRAARSRVALRAASDIKGYAKPPLEPQLALLLDDLFRYPSRFSIARGTEMRHGISVALLNEKLRRAGLASFKVLRRCARIAEAYQLLTRLRLPLREVAERVGCGSAESLQREVHIRVGVSVGDMVRDIHEDALVGLMTAAACAKRRYAAPAVVA